MNWLVEFPESIRLPLRDWVDALLEFLVTNLGPVFEAINDAGELILGWVEGGLQTLPWVVVVALLTAVAWRVSGVGMAAFVAVGMVLIGALGLWDLAMSTVGIVVTATLIAVIVGIPIGIAMARSRGTERTVRPFLDFMQTMPSFVYLVPAAMLFSIGKIPALIATLVYAIPPAIRLTNLGIRQVPTETIEAGEAFGSTSRQLLWKVQLPMAFPTIMAGVNQTVMMALAMVVIASMIGAGGLGQVVLRGLGQLEVGQAFEGGIAIVILAIVIDRLSQSVAASRRIEGEPKGGLGG